MTATPATIRPRPVRHPRRMPLLRLPPARQDALRLWQRTSLIACALGFAAGPARAECLQQYVLNVQAPDLAADDRFGSAVAVDGEYAFVAAALDDERGLNAGAVYVYYWNETEWVFQSKLTAPDGRVGDEFGSAVALSGGFAAIGARGDDDGGNQAGSVYVYRLDPQAGWTLAQTLRAPDAAAADEFGAAVALDGDTLVVGSRLDDDLGSQSGSAYVFVYDGSAWVFEQKLLAADGAAQDNFGVSVAVHGGRILVGAERADALGSDSGAAYVFVWDGSAWVQIGRLVAWDGGPGDRFGCAVALRADRAVVGASRHDEGGLDAGAAYAFSLSDRGAFPHQKLSAQPPVQGDQFGGAIAIGEGLLAVGAALDDSEGLNAGALHLFAWDGAGWALRARLVAPDAGNFDSLGGAAGLGRDFAIVGAALHDGAGADSGAAYVFDVICWTSCPEDLDGNGRIGVGDLSTLLTNFGRTRGATPKQGDVNQDGVIDLSDLALLLVVYGLDCPS